MWKINLTLEGGLQHATNDVRSGNPGWADCKPSGIKELYFRFLARGKDGKDVPHRVIMRGMKEYNFFVEGFRGIGGKKTKLRGFWFLGKPPGTDRVIGFCLRSDKITPINTLDGQEYSGIATAGWKAGIVGDKPYCTIVREV